MPSFTDKLNVGGSDMELYASVPDGSGPFPAVVVAQHATATCCRKCLGKWHRIPENVCLSVEQMAYIARRLDAIQEGHRTALDNTMLMLCSSMITGHHNARELPVVMLGGGGGRINGGRNLDYLKNPNRQMCRLSLSMMDKMNVRPKAFGDAVAPLEEV